jgi:hypothetical protein
MNSGGQSNRPILGLLIKSIMVTAPTAAAVSLRPMELQHESSKALNKL